MLRGAGASHPDHPLAHHVTGEQQHAEGDDQQRGADLDAAHRQGAVAGARAGQVAGPGLGADREGGDERHGDRGADPHDEGRDHAGPEQPLRQREHQHQDGARAGPQADRDDRREFALPSARTGKLLRLGRMGMTPGGGMVVVGVIVMPITVVRMVVGVRLVGLTMIVMAVSVIRAVVVAVMMRRRHRGADRGRAMDRLQRADESASLHPEEPQADQDDERIAHDLDTAHRAWSWSAR